MVGALLRPRCELAAANVIESAKRLSVLLKANFNPNQPRVPAGNPDGGQWTSSSPTGPTADAGDPIESGRREPDNSSAPRPPLQITIRPPALGTPPPLDPPPEIPRQRPRTRQAENRVAREAVKWLARAALRGATGPVGTVLTVIEAAIWLHEHLPNMQSYFDPPRSLDELRNNVATPKKGYDVHHVVEQGPAERAGFPRSLIDAPENLVRIPRYKHWQIDSWYETKNEDYGFLTPRQYAQDKDWAERTRVGLRALIEVGVLKP
jgi:hypothetical protein